MCNVIFVLFLVSTCLFPSRCDRNLSDFNQLCAPACVTSQGNLLNSLGLTNVLSGSSGGTSGLISGGNVVNTAGSLPVVGSSAGSLTGSVSSALGIIQNNLGQVLGTLPIIGNIFGGLGSGSGSGPNTTPSPTFPNVSLPSVTPLPGLDNGGMLCLVNVLKKLPLLLGLPALNGFQPSMFLLNGGTIMVANILDIKINLDCFCNDKGTYGGNFGGNIQGDKKITIVFNLCNMKF